MLHQVVSSVFNLMEEYSDVWRTVSGSEAVPTFGFDYSVGLEPINVNLEKMIEKFQMGAKDLSTVYRSFLPEASTDFLGTLAGKTKKDFLFPDSEWVKIIYAFALACRRRVLSPEHIIKSLTPLYIGKVASFVIETWDSDAEGVEKRLEDLCLAFEQGKSDLIASWDGKR